MSAREILKKEWISSKACYTETLDGYIDRVLGLTK
jgi:hypothetical protein